MIRFSCFAATLLLMLSALATPASARTILVPETEPDFQRALEGADAGDIIDVAPGFLSGEVVEIGEAITLRSREFDANSIYRLIIKDVDGPVEVQGFLFTGITVSGDLWAGVDVWNSQATFRNCRFESLQTGVFAVDFRDAERLRYPIIYSGDVNLAFERCVFRGNEANEGASLFNFSFADCIAPVSHCSGSLSVRECLFEDQENPIWASIALEVVNTTFRRCRTSVIRADRDLFMKSCVVSDFEFHTKWRQLETTRLCEGLTGPAIEADGWIQMHRNTFVDSRFVDDSQDKCPTSTPAELPPFLYVPDDGAGFVSSNLFVGHPGPGIRVPARMVMECNDVFDVAGPAYIEGSGDRTGIDGNVAVAPGFCDREGGDFHVKFGGPADSGVAGCGQIGALPAACDQVPILVQGFVARREGQAIRLEWAMAKPVELEVWRDAGRGREWLARGEMDGFTDEAAPAGEVTYGIALPFGGEELGQVRVPPRNSIRSRLAGAAPNPFNPRTSIAFEVGGNASATVKLEIVDARGRRVATLLREELAPGEHVATWAGRDERQRPVASGAYFALLWVNDRLVGRTGLALTQ